MPDIYRQNDDGTWTSAEPMGPQGWKARLEHRLHWRGWHRLARLLGRWDERGLGR